MRLRQPAVEFWRSTPARVGGFFDQYTASERALDRRAGVIAAVIVNTHRSKHTRAVGPDAFFDSLKPVAPRVMTAEEMRAVVLRRFGRG